MGRLRSMGVVTLAVLWVIAGPAVSACAAIPAIERAALIALYTSTDGDQWTDNSGWKEPPLAADGFALPGTEGTWYGITWFW